MTHQTNLFLSIMGTRHTSDDESMTNSGGQFKMSWYIFPGTVSEDGSDISMYLKTSCNHTNVQNIKTK